MPLAPSDLQAKEDKLDLQERGDPLDPQGQRDQGEKVVNVETQDQQERPVNKDPEDQMEGQVRFFPRISITLVGFYTIYKIWYCT